MAINSTLRDVVSYAQENKFTTTRGRWSGNTYIEGDFTFEFWGYANGKFAGINVGLNAPGAMGTSCGRSFNATGFDTVSEIVARAFSTDTLTYIINKKNLRYNVKMV